jgi:hypothetical protein
VTSRWSNSMGNMHGGALVFDMATADHHVRRSN